MLYRLELTINAEYVHNHFTTLLKSGARNGIARSVGEDELETLLEILIHLECCSIFTY